MSGIRNKSISLNNSKIIQSFPKSSPTIPTLNSIYLEIPNVAFNPQSCSNQKPFDVITNERLTRMSDNFLQLLTKSKTSFQTQYTNYINFINKFLVDNDKQLSQIISSSPIPQASKSGIAHFVNKHIFNRIETIFQLHENIISVIKSQFELLSQFLKDTTLLITSNPIEHFIHRNTTEINKSWLFSRVKFDKMNLSSFISNSKFSESLKQFLIKQKKNKFNSVDIDKRKKDNFEIEREFLRENIDSIQKVKFTSLTGEEFTVVLQCPKESKGLKRMKIDNCINIKKDDFLSFKCPQLDKLKVNKTQFNFIFSPSLSQLNNLSTIIMEHCSLNDKNINEFFNYIAKNKSIQRTLRVLSFAYNRISFVNMKSILNQQGSFLNLEEINLEKNNIYSFISDNFKSLPKLKVLNLCDNNISSSLLFNNVCTFRKNEKSFITLVILANNIFITNNQSVNEQYREYLKTNLSSFNERLKSLSMRMVYNKHICDKLSEMAFSATIRITLEKINLSFCGLDNDIVIKFLTANFGLLNLKKINLSHNCIKTSFFSKYNENKNIIKLDKLERIDLSSNELEIQNESDFKTFCNFVINHRKLIKVKLQYNKFEEDFIKVYNGYNDLIEQMISKGIILVFDQFFVSKEKIQCQIIQYKDKSI